MFAKLKLWTILMLIGLVMSIGSIANATSVTITCPDGWSVTQDCGYYSLHVDCTAHTWHCG